MISGFDLTPLSHPLKLDSLSLVEMAEEIEWVYYVCCLLIV